MLRQLSNSTQNEKLRRWGVGLTILAIGLVVGSLVPQQVIARSFHTGITYLDTYDPAALDQAEKTGARFVRIGVLWKDVAPAIEPSVWRPDDPADPNYRWDAVDLAVQKTTSAGFTPMLLIHWAPAWAQRCQAPLALPGALCDPDPVALARFAAAAARRYSGSFQDLPRVRYWQALNEPNLSLDFYPLFHGKKPVGPALYRRLLNSFYFAIKSAHRSNLVLAAGLGPIAVAPWTIGPLRYARLLLCIAGRVKFHPTSGKCGNGVHFDIFDIHPYTTGGPTHKGHIDDVELGDLLKLQALLRGAEDAGMVQGMFRHTPLWITEFSWDSQPPDPGGLPMRILTRWTAEALYRAWKAGISQFFWLQLRDPSVTPNISFKNTAESGLYFRGATVAEDRPKKNMYAFRFPLVAYSRRSGFFFWGRTPTSKKGRVLIQARKNGRWRNEAVAYANGSGIFEGIAEGSYGRRERGMVRAVYQGERAVPFSLHPVKDFHQPPFG